NCKLAIIAGVRNPAQDHVPSPCWSTFVPNGSVQPDRELRHCKAVEPGICCNKFSRCIPNADRLKRVMIEFYLRNRVYVGAARNNRRRRIDAVGRDERSGRIYDSKSAVIKRVSLYVRYP